MVNRKLIKAYPFPEVFSFSILILHIDLTSLVSYNVTKPLLVPQITYLSWFGTQSKHKIEYLLLKHATVLHKGEQLHIFKFPSLSADAIKFP